jgi:hypothetical protein
MTPPLRDGSSRWAVLLVLVSLPPLIAAPLRAALHAPVLLANLVGLGVSVAAGLWLRRRLPPPTAAPLRWWRLVVVAVVVAVSWACLYSNAMAGLPAWIGSDSGNHAAILHDVVGAGPSGYLGFASMYLAWNLVAALTRLNLFWSFVVVFYAQVMLLAALPLFIGFMVLRRHQGERAWIAGALAGASCALVALSLVALPLQHYFQVEGFWPQIFGLVPLLLLWWLDATLIDPWHRLLAWAITLVLFRYTYGLNLAELSLAFGAVAVSEIPRRFWPLALLAALLALGGALLSVRELNAVVTKWGWFVGYDVKRALVAGAAALAGLLIAAVGNRAANVELGLWRALRLPILFSAGSFAVTAIFLFKHKPSYYVWKYPFEAICLAAVAGGVAVSAVAATVVASRGWRVLVWGAASMSLLITSIVLWFGTFKEYRPGYLERVRGGPHKILRPLADLGAWRIIDDTLATKHKQFGGYLVSYGPMSNFMNSAMGVAEGQKFYFEGRPPKSGPGYCVFFDQTRPDPWPEFNRWYRHRGLAERMNRDPTVQCVEYSAPWDPALKRRICHLCK